MPYNQGDVVVVPFPFTDQTGSKTRPAIVVSNGLVNRSSDVILVQVTTQDVGSVLGVDISNLDVTVPFKPPHNHMVAYCKKIAVIDKALIKNKITELHNAKLTEILERVISVFEAERK